MFELDNEVGKIYDIIEYISIHFNRQKIYSFFNVCQREEPFFNYFDEISFNRKDIPNCIHPLFIYDDKFVLEYFLSEINKNGLKINRFFESLKDNRFKDYCYNKIEDVDIDIEDKYNALIKNGNGATNKSEYLFLINNFDEIINKLIETIAILYKPISELHNKYAKIANDIYQKFINLEKKSVFAEIIDIDRNCNAIVSIVFMNKFIMMKEAYAPKTQIILGIESDNTKQILDGKDVTFNSFMESCSANMFKINILQELCIHKEINIPQIMGKLHISNTAVKRHIDDLLESSIIVISRRDAKKNHYKINNGYIRMLKDVIINFLEKLSDD